MTILLVIPIWYAWLRWCTLSWNAIGGWFHRVIVGTKSTRRWKVACFGSLLKRWNIQHFASCADGSSSLQLQRSKQVNGAPDVEAGTGTAVPQKKWHSFVSPIFIQAFTLTFLAEWGDRSQLTTIILAAREVGRCLHKTFNHQTESTEANMNKREWS